MALSVQSLQQKAVVSVSVPADQREAFYRALASLKRHDDTLFMSISALIVKTVIDAAETLEQRPSEAEGTNLHRLTPAS